MRYESKEWVMTIYFDCESRTCICMRVLRTSSGKQVVTEITAARFEARNRTLAETCLAGGLVVMVSYYYYCCCSNCFCFLSGEVAAILCYLLNF